MGALLSTVGALLSRPDVALFRTVAALQAGVPVDPSQAAIVNNSISTGKYTLLSFVPRSLFEQFRRAANIYFLLITILMCIGTYTDLFTSPLTPYSTLLPLVLVLSITMIKDGFEDLKRHRSDGKVNRAKAHVLSLERQGEVDDIAWKDVRVGRFLLVKDREEIPADVVLLCSSEPGGVAYVETSNIDGETNLKIRAAAHTREGLPPGPHWSSAEELFGEEMEVEYESPNPRIHLFTGTLKLGPDMGNREVAVDQGNLLLRGSRLRNTKWALGLVVYTGSESKISMNARAAPSKQSNIDKVTNRIMFVIFFAMAVVTTVSLVGYLIFNAAYQSDMYYLCYDTDDSPVDLFRDNCDDDTESGDVGQWFTFFILYNNFVPISLYVTLEMINYIQAAYIDNDPDMYDEEQDVPALARTSNMNGDLGQVEYIFSDKTGTLTQNVMRFKRCSVGGGVYGEVTAEEKAKMTPAQLERSLDAPPLSALKQQVAGAKASAASLDFALCLALNHTVVMETDPKTGKTSMQAESPDEEALVAGGKALGVEFVTRSPGTVTVKPAGGQTDEYELLLTIPFDSTRKRMSVVVRGPDGSITLYCKGADNVILDRTHGFVESSLDVLQSHLSAFANDGLRTLLLARRKLNQNWYDNWYKVYHEASLATEGRKEKIADAAKEIEVELEVVGATAIEDRLQDDVPNTIADLGKAGIKVWVLTGDKMETAINIGYSCRLLEPDMTLIKLRADEGDPTSVERQLMRLMGHFNRLVQDENLFDHLWGKVKSGLLPPKLRRAWAGRRHPSSSGPAGASDEAAAAASLPEPLLQVEGPEGAPPLSELESDCLALVVDGPTLTHVLGRPETEKMFLTIAGMCRSVVACRVSPAQKRLIVRLVKRGVEPTPMTLAIGDGANDVGMIQEAQVGVGISGKEGKQAVNNSDFAIAQFRFLRRLLLVHGHWDYRRLCKVILYSFYKNAVLTFILFYFNFSSAFSGQSLLESIVYTGFNWFLAMPILCVGIFDKDVSEETAVSCQKLYSVGRRNMDLNIKVMSKYVCQALVDSLLIYFLPKAAYASPVTVWAKRGYGDGLYVFGTAVYTCLIMAMMLKAFNMTQTWTPWGVFFFVGSLVFYFSFLLIYSLMLDFAYDFYYVGYQMMSRATFWILIIQVPLVSWCVDLGIRFVEQQFFPNVGDHASEFDRGYTMVHRPLLHMLKERAAARAEGLAPTEDASEAAAPRLDASTQKWSIGPQGLHVLNEGVSKDALQELGISEGEGAAGTRSAYAYDHVSADYGRGASDINSELMHIVQAEGEEGLRRRASSLRESSMEEGDGGGGGGGGGGSGGGGGGGAAESKGDVL